MARFLTVYVDPATGRERLGTGGDSQAFHEYASVNNVIRFGLRKVGFPPGQYHIYSWPNGGKCASKPMRTAYKQA